MGILNSAAARKRLVAKQTSVRAGEIEPEALKALRIPVADSKLRQLVEVHVKEIHVLGLDFLALRSCGWLIDVSGSIQPPPLVPSSIPHLKLSQAKVKWGLKVEQPTKALSGLQVRKDGLFRARVRVITLPDGIKHEALEWLKIQFDGLPKTVSFQLAEARDLLIPETPNDAINALAYVAKEVETVKEKVRRFQELQKTLDEIVSDLYDAST
jgi:hypothetical protein